MIIVIVGPTGTGKTKLSIALAKHYKTEIVANDMIILSNRNGKGKVGEKISGDSTDDFESDIAKDGLPF